MARIDSHQHFWRYSTEEFAWIDDSMADLRRDFLPLDLAPLLEASSVAGCVAVQARQTLEETDFLLALAAGHPFVRGVVGWAPLASEDAAATIERYRDNPLLRGFRHIAQAEAEGFLLGDAFNRGVARVGEGGLVYDLLIHAKQLPEALAFVDRHPNLAIVLDHLAKPPIASGELQPWATQIRALARRENVTCKLSGMVTEANWQQWSTAALEPYFDVVLAAFGPYRLMAGSDWPVCTVAADYGRWWTVLDQWTAELSSVERDAILGGVAQRVYRITEAVR